MVPKASEEAYSPGSITVMETLDELATELNATRNQPMCGNIAGNA
jgi:hypothetical protein